MKNRVYSWDFFRSLQLLAISHFHCLEGFFYNDNEPASFFDSFLYPFLSIHSRTFVPGGLNIVALSFFILGFKTFSFRKARWLFPFLFVGVLSLNFVYAYFNYGYFYFEWDIYHYLIVMIFIVWLLERLKFSPNLFWTLFLMILSLIPFWSLENLSLQPLLQQIFVGVCGTQSMGIWALLPWAFWALFFWSLGHLSQKYLILIEEFNSMVSWFLFFCSLVLFGLASALHFFHAPAGPSFSCFVHRPPFWAHFFLLCSLSLFLPLSAKSSINSVFKKALVFRCLSQLYWNKKLGLTYLVHIFILSLSFILVDLHSYSGDQFVLFVILQLALAECTSRLIFYFLRKRSHA